MKKTGIYGFLFLMTVLLLAVTVSAVLPEIKVYENTDYTSTTAIRKDEGYDITIIPTEKTVGNTVVVACYTQNQMSHVSVHDMINTEPIDLSVLFSFDTVKVLMLADLESAVPVCPIKEQTACLGSDDFFVHQYDDMTDICARCGQKLIYTEGLEFTPINEGTEYAVIGLGTAKNDAVIVIPRLHNGAPVTEIGNGAFNSSEVLKRIIVRNSVKSIGDCAFGFCWNLTDVVIPESVETIGSNLLSWAYRLENVIVHEKNHVYHSKGNCLIETETKTLIAGCASSVIPDNGSVERIQSMSFVNQLMMERIHIPDSVIQIEEQAFFNCPQVKTITVGANNPVYHADANCLIKTAETTLILGCGNSILPDDGSVTVIGDYAFADAPLLKSITIPNTVTGIGREAFEGCYYLKSVSIPDSVETIGKKAFAGCTALEHITVGENNKTYRGVNDCVIERATGTLVIGCKNSVIPDDGSITAIGEYAFQLSKGLESIVIPEGVTDIAQYAFSSCSSLQTVTLPNSLKRIGSSVFSNCQNLKEIVFIGTEAQWAQIDKGIWWDDRIDAYTVTFAPPKEKTLSFTGNGDGSCYVSGIGDCTGTVIVIPAQSPDGDKVTGIGAGAFAGCNALTEIHIPNSVTSIGENALSGCSSLTKLLFLGTKTQWEAVVKGSGWDAGTGAYTVEFRYTEGLSYTSNGNGTCSVRNGSCTAADIRIPPVSPAGDTVTTIGSQAFNRADVNSITIPDTVTSISIQAFLGSTGLTAIAVEEGNPVFHSDGNCLILTARKQLIFGCKTSVIPDNGSVTNFASDAFEGCIGLESLFLPDDITSISGGAFAGCINLSSIEVDPHNPSYFSKGNCLIQTRTNTMVLGCKTSIIPDDGSVTRIQYGAFEDCRGLEEIRIPATITVIDDGSVVSGAFNGCSGVTRITVDENNPNYYSEGNCLIERATGKLIVGCRNSVIPTDGSVTEIADNAFCGCEGLTVLTIPGSVRTIGESAFEDCTELTSIQFSEGLEQIGKYAFENCSALTALSLPNGLSGIGNYAFQYCSALQTVSLPDSVTAIGKNAFASCKQLQEINIPTGISEISQYMFSGCHALKTVAVPSNVKKIDNYAFYQCKGLETVTFTEGLDSIGKYAFYFSGVEDIYYHGTVAQWNSITKGTSWDKEQNKDYAGYTVHCTDGDLVIGK